MLIGSESNHELIALCIKHGVNINVQCEEGMTVLHHAVNSFFNYRKEPCLLIQSLLVLGVDQGIIDSQSRDIQGIIEDRKKDFRVKQLDDLAMIFQTSVEGIGMFAESVVSKPISLPVEVPSQDVGQGLIVD